MNINRLRSVSLLFLFFSAGAVQADIDARVYWGKRIDMGVAVSGIVESVPVEVGMRVKKGELLLALEQTPFRTALTEAKAALAQAGGRRKEARRDYDQAKELYDRGLTSNVEFENARLKKEHSEAAYVAAQARLERARYDLSRSSLRAPFDGLVLGKKVEAGQTLISTQRVETVITFVAEGNYVAQGLASGKQVQDLEIGRKATVSVAGNKFTGTISALGLEPMNGKSGDPQYQVSVHFNSNSVLLRAGTEAEIRF